MSHFLPRFLLVFGCLLASSQTLTAQTLPTRLATGRWVLDRWSTDQGLRQNTVTSLLQTADGYLWLATYGGLVRFDGVRFTEFTTKTHPGLGSDRLMALALGRTGEIWIGTDRGLVRFAGGTFREWTAKDGRPEGFTNALYVDSTGAVWISGSLGGLARFVDGRFETFSDATLNQFVGGMLFDRQGNLWVDRSGGHLAVRRAGSSRFEPIRLRGKGTWAGSPQLLDSRGGLWFFTDKGPHRWDGRSLTPFAVPGVGLVVDDGAGGHWLATARGLFHRDSGGRVDSIRATPSNGLGDMRNAFVDRERTLWIGTTTHGLLRVRPRLFDMYMAQDGLAIEQVAAIMRDSRQRLWVGSSCGTTTIFSGGRARAIQHPGCLFSLAETADGTIWGGSYGGGLNRVARDLSFVNYSVRDGLPAMAVVALYADPDTSLWIGTDNGLSHWKAGRFRNYSTADGLPSTQIHYITRDRKDDLWIGTEGGIARLEGDRFRSWSTDDGLAHNNVRAIYQDADGVYWIGTYGGGLSRFDGTRFVTITSTEGLYDDVVSAILEDANGYLWMSGNRGIYRVHRRMLNGFVRGDIPRIVGVGYGPSDGLVTAETNGGFQPSAWQDRDGRLWFATVRGLATVHPRDAVPMTSAPGVAIEGVRVDGRAMPTTGNIELPSGSRSLEIQYTGLTSIAPELLLFRYRMDGLDTSWIYVGDRRTAYYSRLAPGNYRFVVAAANRDGVWNEAGRDIMFIVPTPWYSSLWFRLFAFVAAAAIITAIVQRRLALLHEQQRLQREFSRQLLAGQESERRRIAGELHDSLGQDLLVMKNRAVMALKDTTLPPAVRAHIEEVSAVATQAVENAREISHALRPYQLDRLGLVAALRDLASHASAGGLAVTVDADDARVAATGEVATHVYRIAQEALSNILKHADASRAMISLREENGILRLGVSDNGKGADVARAIGFGLTGMAQRAQILGGTLDVRSTPGVGTTLEVLVPLSVEQRAVLDRETHERIDS